MKSLTFGSKKSVSESKGIRIVPGYDNPGTVSIYLVQFEGGLYFAGKKSDSEIGTTSDWSRAEFMFGVSGHLNAKRIAEQYSGQICIVSCSPAEPYRGTLPLE